MIGRTFGLVGALALLATPLHAADLEAVLVFGEQVTIGETDRVLGDVVVVGGDADIRGSVAGDVVVLGGDLRLGRGASVDGDAVPIGGRLVRSTGALVSGNSVAIATEIPGTAALASVGTSGAAGGAVVSAPAVTMGLANALLASALGAFLLVLGLVFQSAWPERSRNLRRTVEAAPGSTLLVGGLASAASVLLVLFLTITVVGVLVVPAVLLGVGAVWVVGMTGVCEATGDRLPLPAGLRSRRGSFAAGLGLLALSVGVAFMGTVGLLAGIIVLLGSGSMGIGAAVLSRLGRAPFTAG